MTVLKDQKEEETKDKDSSIDLEEKKNYQTRKNTVQATNFEGSDDEVYIESDHSSDKRDDLSLSGDEDDDA